MQQEINISFRYTLKDVQMAQACYLRQKIPSGVQVGMYLLSVSLVVAGVYHFLHTTTGNATESLIFVFFGLYWPFLLPLEQRWRARRLFKKNPQSTDSHWHISEESLRVKEPEANFELKWSCITKVIRTHFGLMLYTSDSTFYLLPRRAFDSPGDFEWLAGLAKTRVRCLRHVL
jgi:hypothetical protein